MCFYFLTIPPNGGFFTQIKKKPSNGGIVAIYMITSLPHQYETIMNHDILTN